jgi:hypothetical protein
MRPLRGRTAAITAAALITTGLAVVSEIRATPEIITSAEPLGTRALIRGAAAPDRDQVPDGDQAGDREPFGAFCRTRTQGSRATANCHNPYPETDRVRLHIECDRWWDLDSDSAPAPVGPAGYVQITGRCWQEIRSVWVSHQRAAS